MALNLGPCTQQAGNLPLSHGLSLKSSALIPASTMHRASSLPEQWNDIIHKSPYDILTISVLSDCLHFLSTAVIKHPGQKLHKGKRADCSSPFHVTIHCFGGKSRQELQAASPITSMIKSREELMHTAHLVACLCSAQSLHSHSAPYPLPWEWHYPQCAGSSSISCLY